MSASKLGCRGVIVMPLATPDIKVNAVRTFGGDTTEVGLRISTDQPPPPPRALSLAMRPTQVILHGNNYDEAAMEARRLSEEQGLAMIHPFDDPLVIAGQVS